MGRGIRGEIVSWRRTIRLWEFAIWPNANVKEAASNPHQALNFHTQPFRKRVNVLYGRGCRCIRPHGAAHTPAPHMFLLRQAIIARDDTNVCQSVVPTSCNWCWCIPSDLVPPPRSQTQKPALNVTVPAIYMKTQVPATRECWRPAHLSWLW